MILHSYNTINVCLTPKIYAPRLFWSSLFMSQQNHPSLFLPFFSNLFTNLIYCASKKNVKTK